MNMQVKQISTALGAEITGIELSKVSDDQVEEIKSLLTEHKVIFFPGQNITQDEHVEYGAKFGELEGHPNLKNKRVTHPKIFELAASTGGIADEWHTDITFQDSPAIMSVLHMVKCPELGGDTMWSNLNAAYEALSDPIKDLCEGLTALHDARPHGKPEKTAIHPVVRLHPISGKKVLYVNEHFTRRIVEMNIEESDMLKASSETSAITGVALVNITAFAVATKVMSGTITSSPFPIPIAFNESWSAAVALDTPIAYLDPVNFANLFSKFFRFGPSVSKLLFNT